MMWEDFEKLEADVQAGGFRVHWDVQKAHMFIADFTPAEGEEPIPDEQTAWDIATRVAAVVPGAVNVRVTDGLGDPVGSAMTKTLRRAELPIRQRPEPA